MRYTRDQRQAITHAVLAARRAAAGTGADLLAFARVFVAAGGVQIPGTAAVDGDVRSNAVAAALLRALAGPSAGAADADPDVAREAARVRAEARLAAGLQDPGAVGFRLIAGADWEHDPEYVSLTAANHGLGAAVVPRDRVVIPPPGCVDYRFAVVSEHDVEM